MLLLPLKLTHRTPLSAQEFWALLALQTMNNPLFPAPSNTSQVPDFHKCQTLALLLPVGLRGSSLDPLWKLSLDNPSPFPAPEITTALVPLGKHWIVKVLLTSPIPYHIVPFYYPESLLQIFGSRAFRTGTVLHAPPWKKLFIIPAEKKRGYYFLHYLNCY